MHRLVITLCAWVALIVGIVVSYAQLPITGAGKGVPTSGGGSSYTGPGDVQAYNSYWSVGPCYSGAYANGTNPAFTLDRASDASTQVIACLTTGLPDYATAITFCLATTCSVRTLNDQAGGGRNMSQTTEANQPTYSGLAVGTCSAMGFSSGVVISATSLTQSQPYNFQAVSKRTDANFGSIMDQSGTTVVFRYWTGANAQPTLYAGNANASDQNSTDNTYQDIWALFNGASSLTRIDGTEGGALSPGTNALSNANTLILGGDTSVLTGNIMQAGVIAGALSSTIRNNVNTNLHGKCGTW